MANNSVKFSFFLIVLIGFCLRGIFIGRDSISPDEALYMYMSQNLISDPLDLRNCTGEFFFQNPPLFMYVLSFLFRALGVVSVDVAHFFNVFLGSCTIVVVYLIAQYLYGTPVGLISAALLSVNPLHWWMSTRILIDVPLTLAIYVSILMLIRNQKIMFFLSATISLVTKYQAALLFFLPLLNEDRLDRKPRLWMTLYLLGIAVFFLFINVDLKTEITWLNYFLTAFEFPNVKKIYLETNYFLSPMIFFFFCVGLGTAFKKRKFSPLLLWVILFGTARVFLPWGWLRFARYSLPLYPGLIILAAYGGKVGFSFLQKRFPDRTSVVSIIFAAILLYVLSISALRGYTVTDSASKAFVGYESVRHFFKNKPADLKILTSSPCQAKYMAPQIAVYNLPSHFTPADTNQFIADKGVDFVLIDRWSPHQPKWALKYFLPQNGYVPVFQTKNLLILKVAKHHHRTRNPRGSSY
jgi:4-amino-4-deoxy-L-arabinose transferase-like glycosyltransferase